MMTFGVIKRRGGNLFWFLTGIGREKVDLALFCDGFQLIDRRWPIDVSTDNQHLFLATFSAALSVVAIIEPFSQLTRCRSLTCTLKAGHQNDSRWLGGQ